MWECVLQIHSPTHLESLFYPHSTVLRHFLWLQSAFVLFAFCFSIAFYEIPRTCECYSSLLFHLTAIAKSREKSPMKISSCCNSKCITKLSAVANMYTLHFDFFVVLFGFRMVFRLKTAEFYSKFIGISFKISLNECEMAWKFCVRRQVNLSCMQTAYLIQRLMDTGVYSLLTSCVSAQLQ